MVTSFAQAVYDKLVEVPAGRVTTYGFLAAALGCRSPRAIGQALRCNPFAPRVPCHRVVAADGSLGGFQGARKGDPLRKKIALLQQEGIIVEEGKIRDFEKVVFRF